VVYAEMPLFAERLGRVVADPLTPTEPTGATPDMTDAMVAMPGTPARAGWLRRATHAVLSSRAVWFAVGAVGGVIGALALTAYVATTQVRAAQTLVVAADGSAPFTRIMDALAASHPGDIVRVEPGVYREQVDVRNGADLVARVPGTVTIGRLAGSALPPLSLTGPFNVRVAGIRIDSDAPADVGVRITAPTATLDLIEITGQIRRAIDLSPASSLIVRGSRIAIAGTVLSLPDEGHATFVNSVLVRTGTSGEAAVSVGPSAQLVLRGNVFAGFGPEVLEGVVAARRAELLAGNLVVPAERAPATGRGGSRTRAPEGGR
jgi:hypothetical protein